MSEHANAIRHLADALTRGEPIIPIARTLRAVADGVEAEDRRHGQLRRTSRELLEAIRAGALLMRINDLEREHLKK